MLLEHSGFINVKHRKFHESDILLCYISKGCNFYKLGNNIDEKKKKNRTSLIDKIYSYVKSPTLLL